jgi:hypothetical protein
MKQKSIKTPRTRQSNDRLFSLIVFENEALLVLTKEQRMTKKQTNQEKACDRFIEHTGRIDAILKRLQGACDDHFGNHPDHINWGDAGFIADIVKDLENISDRVFKEGEYIYKFIEYL